MIAIVKSKAREYSYMVPDVEYYAINDNYITLVTDGRKYAPEINLRKSEVALKESLFDDEDRTVVFGREPLDIVMAEQETENFVKEWENIPSEDKIVNGSAKSALAYRQGLVSLRDEYGAQITGEYYRGMYNGLELALATLDGRDAVYRYIDLSDKDKGEVVATDRQETGERYPGHFDGLEEKVREYCALKDLPTALSSFYDISVRSRTNHVRVKVFVSDEGKDSPLYEGTRDNIHDALSDALEYFVNLCNKERSLHGIDGNTEQGEISE